MRIYYHWVIGVRVVIINIYFNPLPFDIKMLKILSNIKYKANRI